MPPYEPSFPSTATKLYPHVVRLNGVISVVR